MIVYKFRKEDGVFDGEVTLGNTPFIPAFHTFEAPPEAPPGFYPVMSGKWKLVAGEPPEWPPAAVPEPIAIPKAVTMRQARLALLSSGMLESVDLILASITDPNERKAAEIAWEYSTAVERNHPLIAALGAGLNLDDTALDNLFLLAASL